MTQEPHAARRRSACRRAAHAASGANASSLPTTTGSKPRWRNVLRRRSSRRSCSRAQVTHLPAREPRRCDRPGRRDRRTGRRRRGRRGSSAPRSDPGRRPARRPSAARAARAQLGRADRRQVVGEDEDEAARREDVTVPEQRLEPELERRAAAPRTAPRRAGRGRPRRRRRPVGGSQKARPSGRGVVEIRHLTERVDGARRDRLGCGDDCGRLVEPGRLRPEQAERRPPIDENRCPGSFLREVFADDELVAPAGGREPRGGGPVDPRDVVTGPVRPRADDLVALPTADAPAPAERNADEPAARDERKGPRRRH